MFETHTVPTSDDESDDRSSIVRCFTFDRAVPWHTRGVCRRDRCDEAGEDEKNG